MVRVAYSTTEGSWTEQAAYLGTKIDDEGKDQFGVSNNSVTDYWKVEGDATNGYTLTNLDGQVLEVGPAVAFFENLVEVNGTKYTQLQLVGTSTSYVGVDADAIVGADFWKLAVRPVKQYDVQATVFDADPTSLEAVSGSYILENGKTYRFIASNVGYPSAIFKATEDKSNGTWSFTYNSDNKTLVIDKENEMNSKAGLETKAGDGEGQELDTGKGGGKENKENKNDKSDGEQSNSNNTDEPNYAKKIQNFYRRILLFAFLTKNTVVSVDDIINCIEAGDNKRLSSNLGLKKNELKELIKSYKNKFALSSLDYKIQDLNKLTHDSKMSNEEKIKLALSKFGKLGESAVITSFKTCYEMIDLIESDYYQDCINKGRFIVDIASVSGEFAFALHKKLNSLGLKIEDYKHRIISIPKTNICYELTRKVYEYIGLDIDCISNQINAYELIKPNIKFDEMSKNNIVKQYFPLLWKKMNKEERKMIEFGAIVGNPPYHEIVSKSSGNSSLGKELFPSFIKLSTKLTSRYVSLITPSKWFTSDGQDQSFPALREYIKSNNHIKILVNFTDNKDIFPDVSLGSVNYFLYDLNHNSGLTKFYEDGNINYTERPLFEHGLDIIFSMNSMSDIVNKVLSVGKFESLKSHAKGRNAFGISGKKETVEKETSETPFKDSIEVRCAHEVIRYIAKSKITKNTDVMDHYKIFTSKGNGAAGTLDINSSNYIIGKAYVGKPDSICTDSLIPIGCFDTEEEAINLQTYMKTKFLRYLVGVMKSSRNIYQVVYEFVPVQDFTSKSDIDWTKSVSEIDKQLYKKYKLSGEEIKLVESIIKQMA